MKQAIGITTTGGADARLVDLFNGWRAAVAMADGADDQLAANRATDAIVEAMAATQAHELAGIAAKASVLCGAVMVGGSIAEMKLADSLRRDIARLAPEASEMNRKRKPRRLRRVILADYAPGGRYYTPPRRTRAREVVA